MRKTTLILGLIFMIIVLLQSFLVGVGGELFEDFSLSRGGAVGRLVAIMFGIGAAFVLAKPVVSVIIYGLAAVLAMSMAVPTAFHDLFVWGIVSVILAVMSYIGTKEIKRVSPSIWERRRQQAMQQEMQAEEEFFDTVPETESIDTANTAGEESANA